MARRTRLERESVAVAADYGISGEDLRHLREKAGMSCEELGDELGYHRVSVWAWEVGACPIPMQVYDAIVNLFVRRERERAEWRTLVEGLRTGRSVQHIDNT